jgi:hypothetical protein
MHRVKLNWKLFQVAALTSAAIFSAGCGGFAAAPSVSPASFFLPGLVQKTPEKPTKAAAVEPAVTSPEAVSTLAAQ